MISATSGVLCASFKEFAFMYSIGFARIFDADFYPFDIFSNGIIFDFWFIRFFRTSDENSELVGKLKEEHHKKDQF